MSNGNIISAHTPDNHSIFIDAFHNWLLPSQFAVVYLDVNFTTDKLGTAQKEDLHTLIELHYQVRNISSIMEYILVKAQ